MPEAPAAAVGADVLSDVLRMVRLSGAVFVQADVAAPWAARTVSAGELTRLLLPAARQMLLFHVIEQGRCAIALDGRAPVELAGGDVVILPYGDEHTIGSDLTRDPFPMKHALAPALAAMRGGGVHRIVRGDGEDRTRIVCGFLQCDELLFNPLYRGLPALIRVSTAEGFGSSLLAAIVRTMASEVHDMRPGGGCLLSRLSELLFIEVLRRHMAGLAADAVGLLGSLNDPLVGRALQLLHGDPAHPWTVDELAHRVSASRSLLGARFRLLVGQPPMHYLASWRLQLAAALLRDGGDGIAAIAARVGYESQAAFNRAFKRRVGEPPAAWRRRQLTVVGSKREDR